MRIGVVLAVGLTGACAAVETVTPADMFWERLSALCGVAASGTVIEAPADDTTFANRQLVMHVRHCEDSVIRIPFHVGENRSRTWVLSRTADGGVRLKHDHRHEDGAEDSVTQYGGDARTPIDSASVEFPADSFTVALIPAAATNVWTIEVEPRRQFVYALRREGTNRRFRIEFDLTQSLPAPSPPWGSR